MKRAGRKPLILLAVLLLLLMLLAGAVQIVLWTDKPGQWVLSALGEHLGVEIVAENFRTGWTGRTRVQGLTARRPLEETPFLEADELTLDHNALIHLALMRRFRLDSIRLERAKLHLRQEEGGRWNIEDFIDRFRGREEEEEPEEEIRLPEIEGRDLMVTVAPYEGPIYDLGPLSLRAESSKLIWKVRAAIPDRLDLEGRLVTASPFTHSISLDLRGLDELIEGPAPVAIRADWEGRFVQDELTGRLGIEKAEAAAARLSALARVRIGGGEVEVIPERMTIEVDPLPLPVGITGGFLRYADNRLTVSDLTARVLDTIVNISGIWDIPASQIRTEGRWAGMVRQRAPYSGRWEGDLHFSPDGYKCVNLEIAGEYGDPHRRFQTQLDLAGSGSEWGRSFWTLEAEPLTWQDPNRLLRLGPARLEASVDWPEVRLESVSTANVRRLEARGRYSAADQTWDLSIDAEGIDPGRSDSAPVNLNLRAEGTSRQVAVRRLDFNRPDLHLSGVSTIRLPDGWIENGHLRLSGRLPEYGSESPLREFSGNPWQVNTVLNGTLLPTDLNVNGQMDVRAPAADPNRPNGSKTLHLPFELRLVPPQVSLKTASYVSEKGSWIFHGRYDMKERAGRLYADLETIPLKVLSEYFGAREYQGVLSGHLIADFPSPDLRDLDLSGEWNVSRFGAVTFTAESVRGRVRMRNGRAELRDIVARQGMGVIRGHGVIDLNRPRQADFNISASDWTYPAGDFPVSVVADANTVLHVDMTSGRFRGEGVFRTVPGVLDKPIGSLGFRAEFDERVLTLDELGGRLLGGAVSGRVRIPLHDWMDSRANLDFRGVELARLSDWQRGATGLEGHWSGHIEVQQTDDPRRLEPLRLLLQSEAVGGRFRGAPFEGVNLTAFAGSDRILITDSDLAIFSGHIESRARLSRRANTFYIHWISEIENLSLPDLIRAVDPNAEPVAGLLSGRATFITTPDLDKLNGRIDLELTRSDLINHPVIGTLYRTLAFQFGKTRPEGAGTLRIRLEDSRLRITSFYYFNRGVEVRGSAEVEDIRLGAESPVSGLVMATTQPLRGIDLPGIRELDKVMRTLQTGAAVVRLEGTLGKVEPQVVPLPEVSSAVRSLLWGQLRGEEN